MFGKIAIIFAFALPFCVEAQFEACHTNVMTPHHFLNLSKFSGTWYPLQLHYARADLASAPDYTCMEASIEPTANEDMFTLTETYIELVGGYPGNFTSRSLDVISGNSTGFLRFPLPSKWRLLDNGTEIGQSTIVAADEGSWALQYLCVLRNGTLEERMMLLSRNRFLSSSVQDVLEKTIFAIGFRPENSFEIKQFECSASTTIRIGEATVFTAIFILIKNLIL